MSGSKLICQLPEPFRRLSRLSSPVIAKASTICTYSLDPITLKPKPFLNLDFIMHETCVIVFLKQLFLICKVVQIKMVFYFTYICFKNFHSRNSCQAKCSILQSVNIIPVKNNIAHLNTSLSSHNVHSLYFFHFVKEQSS
jgi:hypothetical protein